MIKLFLPKFWRRREIISYALLSFSFFYRLFIGLYRFYYTKISFSKFPVPIIVIGNITVGGTGKTPLVIFLAGLLKEHGYNPGIISRGYGRRYSHGSIIVTSESRVEQVGDEASLIFKDAKCPVIVDSNRVAAARKLLEVYKCDVVISDDGLQHYKLPRYLEIALVDVEFAFGNNFCLPAGPLREPISRLKKVDFVIKNFNTGFPVKRLSGEYSMVLEPMTICNVKDPIKLRIADDFKGQVVHAVAGIGMPDKYFRTLRQLGLTIIEHPFPDHHMFCAADFSFASDKIVMMTEKDAVKCTQLATDNFWYLKVRAKLNQEFVELLLNKLKNKFL